MENALEITVTFMPPVQTPRDPLPAAVSMDFLGME